MLEAEWVRERAKRVMLAVGTERTRDREKKRNMNKGGEAINEG